MQPAFDTSFESRLAKLNLTAIMAHVKDETGMDDETLARAESLYRNFLTLKALHPQQAFVPPVIVDMVWHSHIMHTQQYMADCEMLFGTYIHHTPSKDTETLYQSGTMVAMEREFGINLNTLPLPAHYLRAGGCS